MRRQVEGWPHLIVELDGPAQGVVFVEKTRVPAHRLFQWWVRGRGDLPVEVIMRRYPQLTPAQVLTALAYALDHEGEMDRLLGLEKTRGA